MVLHKGLICVQNRMNRICTEIRNLSSCYDNVSMLLIGFYYEETTRLLLSKYPFVYEFFENGTSQSSWVYAGRQQVHRRCSRFDVYI